ncbi:YSIRK-type signal peptide-containing protein [Limosilactobacillus difficilis]|uniref:YSIRK-type signal peptide-containing protein n=1 Tax=Limosilactobacillus difficilis TaxID=2991838 RepID=UPI0024B9E1C2|nr:YSIRK-type signal peptide-containing protein [Limosilactobacillus difficilis]
MKVNNLNDTKQRWSLRKLSVGVCSVLLGMALLGASQTASADTTTVSPAQTTAVAVQPSAATNSQQATNVQNAMVPSNYANSLNGYRPGDAQSQALRNASYEGKAANVKDANLPVSNVKMYQHNGGA